MTQPLSSRVCKALRRPLATKRVLLMHWYNWVDVGLEEYLNRHLPPWYSVYWFTRRKAYRGSPEPPAELPDSVDAAVERDYQRVGYGGLNLWEVCKSSICDTLLTTAADPRSHAGVIRDFYAKAIHLLHVLEAAYDRLKPHAIVVEQGLQFDMRVAVEVARRRGVKTVAIENSFLKDYFFMDDGCGAITNRHTLARQTWDRIRARQLSDEQRAEVAAFLEQAGTTFRHPDRSHAGELCEQHGLPRHKRLVLLIGQVATDAAIVMDSPVYPDQVDFIRHAAESMAAYQDTHHLVVRLHPKEAFGASHNDVPFGNRTLARLHELGVDRMPHVTVIHSDQANTYQLMDEAAFGLTLTSQAGLELLTRRKPLLVAGDAFYASKGFTADVSRPSQLAPTIADLVDSTGLTERQSADLDNFLHTLCFDYLFPKDLRGQAARVRRLFA